MKLGRGSVATIGSIVTVLVIGSLAGKQFVSRQKQKQTNSAVEQVVQTVDTRLTNLNYKSNVSSIAGKMVRQGLLTQYYFASNKKSFNNWSLGVKNGVRSAKITDFRILAIDKVLNHPELRIVMTDETDVYKLSDGKTERYDQKNQWEVELLPKGWAVNA